jgi:hypothetical protein
MIFIVQLHYALSIHNAFCLENNPNYKSIKFNFHTFLELNAIFTELEFDQDVAVNNKGKRKRPCETIEIDMEDCFHVPPQIAARDVFVASFEQFKYDVASKFEDNSERLHNVSSRLNQVELSVDLVYKAVMN